MPQLTRNSFWISPRLNQQPARLAVKRRELLKEPFTAIATAYGEQAAHAAADYLFLQRSLDETLAGLAYPEVAKPAEYRQAVKAYSASIRASNEDWKRFVVDGETDGLEEFNAKTFEKLSGSLNRLVLQPARETVSENIAPGTRFARVPEPGACSWCLMVASNGAMYSKDSVGMTKATRFHDNCRCIGVEVSDSAPLPRLNEELESAWKKAMKGGGSQGEVYRKWENFLQRRSKILQSQVVFPPVPGVETPTYRHATSIKGRAKLADGSFTEVEVPLPDLSQMPGHVLYGWTTAPPWGRATVKRGQRPPGDYSLDNKFGHRWNVKAGGKTLFPRELTDQQIVDGIRDILEGDGGVEIQLAPAAMERDRKGNEWLPSWDYQVKKYGRIGDIEVTVKYEVVDGIGVRCTAYVSPEGR